MRVAFVVGEFPSISETFVLQQIACLREAGATVEIFPLDPGGTSKAHEQDFGDLESLTFRKDDVPRGVLARWSYLARHFRTMNAPTRRLLRQIIAAGVTNPRRLACGPLLENFQLLRRLPFDVVHAHFGHIGSRCASLPWSRQLPPLITTFHGWDANVAPGRYGEGCYRELFARGSLFTVNSDFLKRKLTALGCSPERIVKLPMGVDVEKFAYRRREREPSAPVRLLTVGRLVPVKGHAIALEAVAKLLAEGKRLRYLILGGGKLQDELKGLTGRLGIAEHVEFLGAQPFDVVRETYYRADLFLLPSVRTARGDEETQGVVVQEAQATGLPAIVTSTGGVAEGIISGVSGVSAVEGDAGALAEAISELISREGEWESMGLAGRQQVEARYDSRRLSVRLIEVYQEAIRS